jgi:hypothetical protein
MSRSRMFGDEHPSPAEVPSPRTTIVGGRPPEDGASLPPVPTGIQDLLRLASVDGAFREELLRRRGEIAEAAGVRLTANERAVLGAVPAAQLEAMIGSVPPPSPDRRGFLREVASAAVVLLGGASIAAVGTGCPTRGHSSDIPPAPTDPSKSQTIQYHPKPAPGPEPTPAPEPTPPRPIERIQAPGGAAPDPPPPRPIHNEMEVEGGAAPHPPQRPDARVMPSGGGAAPDRPPPRPQSIGPQVQRGATALPPAPPEGEGAEEPPARPLHNEMNKKGGINPDLKRKIHPDAGPPKTRGIQHDVPAPRNPFDDEKE